MKIGNLHIGLVRTGFCMAYLKGYPLDARGSWHWAVSWAKPAFQCGAITRKGYGGLLCQPHKAPNGKRAWFVGCWA